MAQSEEYRDLLYVVDVLSSGTAEQFGELEQLIDGFPNGTDSYLARHWIRHAVDGGSKVSIEWMLSRKVDLTFQDSDGYTVLDSALERTKPDKYEVLELLLKFGAPVNIQGINDWTPSHHAVMQDDVIALQILFEKGADFSIRTRIDNYTTPLEEAKSFGKQKAVQFFEHLA